MRKNRIIVTILICLLLLPINAFTITYGKTGENTNFTGDVNIPSGSNYYINGVVIGGNSYPVKWSGLGMGLFHTTTTSDFDGYVDTLLANGFTELRVDIPCYNNTDWTTASKAAVIRAVAKGAKVIWGVNANSGTITAANWDAYVTASLAGAQWAQDNGVFEFQLGNEFELNNDDDTLTDAEVITALKAHATNVQAIFTAGNVSYSCFANSINDWRARGWTPPDLFSDGFESGDLMFWAATTVTDEDKLSVETAAKLTGDYGLSVLIDDTTAKYVEDATPNAETRYRFRFNFDPNSISMTNDTCINISRGSNAAYAVGTEVRLKYLTASGYSIAVTVLTDGAAEHITSFYNITDAPHLIEVDYKVSSGADDGTCQLWIDDADKQTLTGQDNDTKVIDMMKMGAIYVPANASGTLYFDDFASNNDGSAIGTCLFDGDVAKGDIDILASNIYSESGAAHDPIAWEDKIGILVNAFGVDGTYLTEWGPNSSGLDYYSTDEAVQATKVTEMLDYIKASGMTRAFYFCYTKLVDEEGNSFGALKNDGTYRLLWNSLIGSELMGEDEVEAYIFDTDAENITGNWVNTTYPWADNEVSDTLTASSCTGTSDIATHVTITDNEDTAENDPIVFVEAGDLDGGNLGLESDGTLYYTPSTGIVTATGFVGALTGAVTGNADTVTGFTPASGSLTLAGADALTLTTSAATDVTLPTTGTLMANLVEDTTPDLGGELDAGAHSIGFTQQAATGDGTTTINWTLGNKFFFTCGAAEETFTFTHPTNPCNLVLVIKQDATGSRTVVWEADVFFPGGTHPTLSTGANLIDIVSFYYDGTSFYGMAGLDFK